MNEDLTIVDYDDKLAASFRDLNLHWLNKYFVVEPIDREMLSHPQKFIIDKGGHIFFAKVNGEIAGTFALMKTGEFEYELSKMAVDEKFQGKKIGNQLLEFCINRSKMLGARKLILYSNTILKPAIHLYEKYGFKEVPVGNSEYKRSNIKMELNL
jgi:ribosomal protein S18 acetylase RimI-like enzyme